MQSSYETKKHFHKKINFYWWMKSAIQLCYNQLCEAIRVYLLKSI